MADDQGDTRRDIRRECRDWKYGNDKCFESVSGVVISVTDVRNVNLIYNAITVWAYMVVKTARFFDDHSKVPKRNGT